MILIDVNLLIYSINRESPDHTIAKKWLESTLAGPDTIGFAWITILSVLRLTTRPGICSNPLSLRQAFELVDSWLERPASILLNPGARHRGILRDLLTSVGPGGKLTTDAHLAALAIENEAELYSADIDFAKFRKLRWRNPLRSTN